jgi:hypothetical protein
MNDNRFSKAKADLLITASVAAALMLYGCGNNPDWTAQNDTAICRDRAGNRVPDSNCDARSTGAHPGFYGWYYLSRGGYIPAMGETVSGGRTSAVAGHSYAHAPSSASISRGGFGASAHSFGGFGG